MLSEKEAEDIFQEHATDEGLDVDQFKTVVAMILSRDDGMIPGGNHMHINTKQVQCVSKVCAFWMHACVSSSLRFKTWSERRITLFCVTSFISFTLSPHDDLVTILMKHGCGVCPGHYG